jgi:hypothetical protein
MESTRALQATPAKLFEHVLFAATVEEVDDAVTQEKGDEKVVRSLKCGGALLRKLRRGMGIEAMQTATASAGGLTDLADRDRLLAALLPANKEREVGVQNACGGLTDRACHGVQTCRHNF